MAKKITKWEPDNFELEMTTHWSFPQRGDWATHDAKWRGNWSPYIPRNILLRYSQEGDLVLDQFAGGGTTLVEAKLLNRNIIGVDVNDVALDRCREKTAFEHEGADGKVYTKVMHVICILFPTTALTLSVLIRRMPILFSTARIFPKICLF